MSIIRSVFEWVEKESVRSQKNRISVMCSVIYAYIKYGVNPKEYFLFDFDGKTDAQRKTFFTRQMFRKLLKRNNDPAFVQILNDKYIFSQTFAKFTGRECIRSGKNMDFEELAVMFSRTDRIVYKPSDGSGGVGIEVFDKKDYPEIRILFDKLRGMPDGVVEEWINQHSAMAMPYPRAVNCVRVASLFRDGKCNFLGATLTVGFKNKEIANAIQGALFALVDVNTGKVISHLGNYSGELYEKHPDTGFAVYDFQIPHWEKVRELIAKAAAVVPQVGYIGWDVAICEDGPVLIEGNSLSAGYTGYQYSLLRKDGKGSRDVWGPYVN